MNRTEEFTNAVTAGERTADTAGEAPGQTAYLQALSEQLYLDSLRYDGNVAGGAR